MVHEHSSKANNRREICLIRTLLPSAIDIHLTCLICLRSLLRPRADKWFTHSCGKLLSINSFPWRLHCSVIHPALQYIITLNRRFITRRWSTSLSYISAQMVVRPMVVLLSLVRFSDFARYVAIATYGHRLPASRQITYVNFICSYKSLSLSGDSELFERVNKQTYCSRRNLTLAVNWNQKGWGNECLFGG